MFTREQTGSKGVLGVHNNYACTNVGLHNYHFALKDSLVSLQIHLPKDKQFERYNTNSIETVEQPHCPNTLSA